MCESDSPHGGREGAQPPHLRRLGSEGSRRANASAIFLRRRRSLTSQAAQSRRLGPSSPAARERESERA